MGDHSVEGKQEPSAAQAPPIRKTLVPHFGHISRTSERPFLKVICLGFGITTFFLHSRQYPRAVLSSLVLAAVRADATVP
jgi:hypothetical protein